MKKYYIIISLIFILGCNVSPEQQLIGIWNSGHEPIGYEFKEDKTFEVFEYTGENGEKTLIESGNWRIENEKLVLDTKKGYDTGEQSFELNFNNNKVLFEVIPDQKTIEATGLSTLDEYFDEYGFTKSE